ncbi:MAG: hypothetical protein MUF49_00530 [Oculatellaceae cyanobacterium Prado106]|jgi:hypothetical protein|nr:hypothetical protein [Oculatellaceae cyanobacterium Prado106]
MKLEASNPEPLTSYLVKSKSPFAWRGSHLALWAFATAFFPRVLVALGFPAVINFLHFLTIPWICWFVLTQSRSQDAKAFAIARSLLTGLVTLFGIIVASAILNDAGVVNVVFSFLLYSEPFMWLLVVVLLPLSTESHIKPSIEPSLNSSIESSLNPSIESSFNPSIEPFLNPSTSPPKELFTKPFTNRFTEPSIKTLKERSMGQSGDRFSHFRTWWLRFGLINLVFAMVQAFVLRLDQSNADNIKGIFIGQGSGHVVGGSVSLAFAIYYFSTAKHQSAWVRSLFIVAALIHLVKCDGKQVLAVFLTALLLLVLTKVKSLVRFIQYVAIAIVFVGLMVLAANTVFSALLTWFDLDIQREGMELKLAGFSILPTFYHSPLNWLLGLGPGHSISRLGGWLVWDYFDLLQPAGITVSEASRAVWRVVGQSWLGDRSSWFSPLFGWAGIWGDLGFAGVGVYLSLWWIVWRRLCSNDLSRFLVLTVLIFGTILTQIEEPGYMLFMTGIIGLNWHESRLSLHKRR